MTAPRSLLADALQRTPAPASAAGVELAPIPPTAEAPGPATAPEPPRATVSFKVRGGKLVTFQARR